MDLKENIVTISEEDYGEQYRNHILEIYKIYVEMVDRIYARRLTSNKFFLSINTAIIALLGYRNLFINDAGCIGQQIFLLITGSVICIIWLLYIITCRTLRASAFEIIHKIETLLPIRPYYAEEQVYKSFKCLKRYFGFSNIEMAIPFVFLVIYIILMLLK